MSLYIFANQEGQESANINEFLQLTNEIILLSSEQKEKKNNEQYANYSTDLVHFSWKKQRLRDAS